MAIASYYPGPRRGRWNPPRTLRSDVAGQWGPAPKYRAAPGAHTEANGCDRPWQLKLASSRFAYLLERLVRGTVSST